MLSDASFPATMDCVIDYKDKNLEELTELAFAHMLEDSTKKQGDQALVVVTLISKVMNQKQTKAFGVQVHPSWDKMKDNFLIV